MASPAHGMRTTLTTALHSDTMLLVQQAEETGRAVCLLVQLLLSAAPAQALLLLPQLHLGRV